MTMNSSGPISLAGSTAGQSIAVELGQGATSQISLNDAAVRSLAGIASGAITMPINFWGKSNITGTQKGMFAYGAIVGYSATFYNTQNIVTSNGVLGSDLAGVGTQRYLLAASTYGGDKGIFAYGSNSNASLAILNLNMRNLLSNTGVVSADQTGAGTPRWGLAGCTYGSNGEAIMAYGAAQLSSLTYYNLSNKISNTGVVAGDTTGVGSARAYVMASSYGGDKGIFGYGGTRLGAYAYGSTNVTNKVSNTGVISGDTAGVGTIRAAGAASSYGGDKGIFGYGATSSGASTAITNLISNTGVVASDVTQTTGNKYAIAGCSYGGDKGIFALNGNTYNLITNVGTVGANLTATITNRTYGAACGYSFT